MSVSNKGAEAPFFIPAIPDQAIPSRRFESLLQQALNALHEHDEIHALLMCEIVCRYLPDNVHSALLRAHLLKTIYPSLALKASFQAWRCQPDSAQLQDQLLQNWLASGASSAVRELGWHFLAQRISSDTACELKYIMQQADTRLVIACAAKRGELVVDYEFFDTNLLANYDLCLQSETQTLIYPLSHAMQSLRFKELNPQECWSVYLRPKGTEKPIVASGSPVRLAAIQANQTDYDNPDSQILIVIPVYKGVHQVRQCLESVIGSLAENTAKASILVIDDASPEAELSQYLQQLNTQHRIGLIRNPLNLGFIETVNRGMREAKGRHLALLNADTQVCANWLDQMLKSLSENASLASVSAWSNNGEISSFPVIAKACRAPDTAQLHELQSALQDAVNLYQLQDIEIPVCCGFAMLIRDRALQQVGYLDAYSLKRGYGEEVDWCLRASALGYTHALNPKVFISHHGSSSFQSEKHYRVRQNLSVINSTYPEYRSSYQSFIRNDGLRFIRAKLLDYLAQKKNSWLSSVQHFNTYFEPIQLQPKRSQTSLSWIIVWANQLDRNNQNIVMKLAYSLSKLKNPKLKLLVLGDVNEKIWGTGNCYVLPKNDKSGYTVIEDEQILNLLHIEYILTSEPTQFVDDPRVISIDHNFDLDGFVSKIEELH